MLGCFDDGTPWMRSPVRLSDSHPPVRNDVPGYGEHTREVLLEAGYTDDDVTHLVRHGVVQSL
jgi:crotonobetainyl-CoA:carnitine CoA-transferase CaiB-like acyl-CoA transferase